MSTALLPAARAALLGLAVGDALGVPVKFIGREARCRDPVASMRGYGTHHQPPGTWSDDSSLTFCLAETLARPEGRTAAPDLVDFGCRANNWLNKGGWTAHGESFDVGNATRVAIQNLSLGIAPTKAGPLSEFDNGNWLPTQAKAAACYKWPTYGQLLDGSLQTVAEAEIKSSGYVVHALAAVLWCLLTHNTHPATVLAAVNLGDDTDTTGAVAGGLAGLAYGEGAIPAEWLGVLVRRADSEDLTARLVGHC